MSISIASFCGKTLRAFSVPRLFRALSYTRVMDQSKKEIAIPPPIPDKLKDLIYAFRASKTLFAACDLGIFDILHDSQTPQSALDVAAKIKADPDATVRLMDTLVAL